MRSPIFLLLFLCCACRPTEDRYSSKWSTQPELIRPWAGAEFWLNPLQDWRQQNGHLELVQSGGNRQCVWLTRALDSSELTFRTSVDVNLTRLPQQQDSAWVGFTLGLQGQFNDYRDDATHGSGLAMGLTPSGRLFVGKTDEYSQVDLPEAFRLEARGLKQRDGQYYIFLEVFRTDDRMIGQRIVPVDPSWLTGLLALTVSSSLPPSAIPWELRPAEVQHPKKDRGGQLLASFHNWELSGPRVQTHPERSYGPILWAQFSRDTEQGLRLSAQLAPLGNGPREVELRIDGETVQKRRADSLGYVAVFELPDIGVGERSYELIYRSIDKSKQLYQGTIPAMPAADDSLRVASLSCVGDGGFPHRMATANIASHEADLLLFHGDQIYEHVGGYGTVYDDIHDYLRKWYLFGWAFRDLLRDRPSVIIPDDHDVFHGNLWGEGGTQADTTLGYNYASQDDGGYKCGPIFVNTVHRTQTSHLPPPTDPSPALQGISVYYTYLNYGPVDFAILADRQFKSAPKELLSEAAIENGWPQNLSWNPKTQAAHPDAQLLGLRQELFLDAWRSRPSPFKAAVSASPFVNVATLPADLHHDKYVPNLPIYREGDYPPDDRPVADFDANAWPQNKRDLAVNLLKQAGAIHLVGDQHLGSTGQYGVEAYGDAGYWVATPAISNIWPRRWYPAAQASSGRQADDPRYLGNYEDGFGNLMTVMAVANPHDRDREPQRLFDRAPGYSILDFDPASREVTVSVYPLWERAGGSTYTGWPIVIRP